MPSNNTGRVVKTLFKKYPSKMALLLNPQCIRPHQFKFRYAIDNNAFIKFDEKQFFKMLDTSLNYQRPLFVVSPDVVGCHDRTLALWHYYRNRLTKYKYPVAFVVQDGCQPENIPLNEVDWIFVGGTDPWKMENLPRWVKLGKPCHVGRVNSIGRLRYCESLGVTSVDGTGWMRARDAKFFDLMEYFEGEKQCRLF